MCISTEGASETAEFDEPREGCVDGSRRSGWPAGDRDAWRRVLRGAGVLLGGIDRDLVRRSGLTLAEYSVLVAVHGVQRRVSG
jgi:hypothetical protein